MKGERLFEPDIAWMWFLHFAFVAAVPIYAVIYALILGPQFAGKTPPGNRDLFFTVLSGISGVAIILALTVDRWLKPTPRYTLPPEDPADGFLARAMLKNIVVNACYESIAVYGLVGVFLGFTPCQSYLFMSVSLLALLARIAALRKITDTYYQLKSNE